MSFKNLVSILPLPLEKSLIGLTTLSIRCKLHTWVIMFKCLHSLAPPYLSALFHVPYVATSLGPLACTHQINVPTARTSLRCKCLSFVGASTWRVFQKNKTDKRPPNIHQRVHGFTLPLTWSHSILTCMNNYFEYLSYRFTCHPMFNQCQINATLICTSQCILSFLFLSFVSCWVPVRVAIWLKGFPN